MTENFKDFYGSRSNRNSFLWIFYIKCVSSSSSTIETSYSMHEHLWFIITISKRYKDTVYVICECEFCKGFSCNEDDSISCKSILRKMLSEFLSYHDSFTHCRCYTIETVSIFRLEFSVYFDLKRSVRMRFLLRRYAFGVFISHRTIVIYFCKHSIIITNFVIFFLDFFRKYL